MPIIIPDGLPAKEILTKEGVPVINSGTSVRQDIRPLRVALLNIMPTKIETETQWLRLLGATPLQIELTLLRTESYPGSAHNQQHLETFYTSQKSVDHEYFDALIITGAPVEHLEFSAVKYWSELKRILEWSKRHVYSTLHICWGAQAGLYHHYNIAKLQLPRKCVGIFRHKKTAQSVLFSGCDDRFEAPHSRYTTVDRDAIIADPQLSIVAESNEVGIYAVQAHGLRQIFLTGHPEYERDTIAHEYTRDQKQYGRKAVLPKHYFVDNDPTQGVQCSWRANAQLLVQNWTSQVYQHTPYDLTDLAPVI